MTINEAKEQIMTAVEDIFTSDNYKNYLNVMLSFHDYSLCNRLLIYYQMPTATLVAGYKAWNTKSRYVKKGEKGISILAPMIKKITDETGREQTKLVGFRPTYVFDVSQTDGEELPTLGKAEKLTADVNDYSTLRDKIISIIKIPVSFVDNLNGANGTFSYDTNDIKILDNMSKSQTIKTMIHEYAHSLLHKWNDGIARDIKEVQAESVAYMVCSALGIDSASYSFNYVANWGQMREWKELKKELEFVEKTANDILDAIMM